MLAQAGASITPTNVTVDPESNHGCAQVRPATINREILFVQRAGRKIRAMGYRYDIDGFRIDTAKHVNPEFWQEFVPAVRQRARQLGIPNFHVFGEVATDEMDPALLARWTRIADLPGVSIVRATLQAAPVDPFASLAPGDVLFIDSSHILMPGSDVDLLFNRVLPELPSGTLVHIHDIFLPFDYPALWGWRNYNEQQGVVPLLVSGAYRPLFASVWIERAMADRISRSIVPSLPRPAEAMPASLWLEKR